MARTTLQPVSRFAFLVVAAHVGVALLLWWWLAGQGGRAASSSQQVTWISPADFEVPERSAAPSARISEAPPPPKPEVAPPSATPSEVKSMLAVAGTVPPATTAKPLPKAIAIDPSQAAALMKEAEEVEKKQRQPEEKPNPEPVSPAPRSASKVLDVSRFITVSRRAGPEGEGAHLESVDRAIRDAFMSTWEPPASGRLRLDQRTAEMNMAVDRAGHVLSFTIVRRSGSDDFDLSLREAADRLTSINATLPPTYPADRYDFQLHFHVE